jgi:uncharacterized protein
MLNSVLWISLSFMLLLMLLLLMGQYFYGFVIKRNTKEFIENESFQKIIKSMEVHVDWLKEKRPYNWKIKSFDGLKLAAKFIPQEQPNKRFVIALHGFASNCTHLSGAARLFYEHYGFNVLLPDLRGHGNSEGEYIGMGYHDRSDLLKWIDFLISRFGEDIEILLFGVSMGGATVSLASGESLPKNVKLIISDCAYSDVNAIFTYHLKRRFKLPRYPFIPITSFICRLKAKYSFGSCCVYREVEKSQTPFLFIHGSQDDFVPTQMAFELFKRAKGEKDLVIINGAGHASSYNTDEKTYIQAIDEKLNHYFFNK